MSGPRSDPSVAHAGDSCVSGDLGPLRGGLRGLAEFVVDQQWHSTRGILDNVYDGVYFVDAFRRITYWNKGAERITGFTAE